MIGIWTHAGNKMDDYQKHRLAERISALNEVSAIVLEARRIGFIIYAPMAEINVIPRLLEVANLQDIESVEAIAERHHGGFVHLLNDIYARKTVHKWNISPHFFIQLLLVYDNPKAFTPEILTECGWDSKLLTDVRLALKRAGRISEEESA